LRMGKKEVIAPIAENREARAAYEILETYEAGISLLGSEVKSLREKGTVSFKDSFVKFKNGEAFLQNLYIAPYRHASYANHEPLRDRKLLLHKREILRLSGKVKEKGLTVIPLKLYWKNNKVKVLIGLARGKKLHDRRRELREKAIKRELEREFKGKIRL